MKKRILSLLLMAVMSVTLLAGCGGNQNNAPENQNPVDLTQFYNDMLAAAEEAPMMMDLAADAEMLEMSYPGLKDIQTKQLVAYAPMISAVAMEFVFVEVANPADVETVKGILQARIDAQVDGGAFYPETIEQWASHSEIVTMGNYVCLFVTADKDVLIDALRNGTEIPTWAKAPEMADEDVMGEEILDEEPAVEEPSEQPSEQPEPEVTPEPAPEQPAPEAPASGLAETYVAAINNCGSEMVAYNTTLYTNMPEDADGAAMAPMALEMLGLTAEDVETYAVNMSFMNVKAYNISLIQPKQGKTQAVVDALNTYVSNTQMNFETYLADQYDIALAAKVEVLSNGTVALVMCEGQDTVFQSIRAAVEG